MATSYTHTPSHSFCSSSARMRRAARKRACPCRWESDNNQGESSSYHTDCRCDRNLFELSRSEAGMQEACTAVLARRIATMAEHQSRGLCNVPEARMIDQLLGRSRGLFSIRAARSPTFTLPLLRGFEGCDFVARARALWILLYDLAWTLGPSLSGLPFAHCEGSTIGPRAY